MIKRRYQSILVNIRLFEINDYDEVYDLWKSTAGMGLRSLDDSLEGIEKFLVRNPNINYVALIDDKIVGVIMAGNDGRRGYIYHLAVKESHRRKKIASKLVNKCLESLKREGIKKVALVAYSDNKVGNAFWHKLGFIQRDDLVYRNLSLNEENI